MIELESLSAISNMRTYQWCSLNYLRTQFKQRVTGWQGYRVYSVHVAKYAVWHCGLSTCYSITVHFTTLHLINSQHSCAIWNIITVFVLSTVLAAIIILPRSKVSAVLAGSFGRLFVFFLICLM